MGSLLRDIMAAEGCCHDNKGIKIQQRRLKSSLPAGHGWEGDGVVPNIPPGSSSL